MFQSKKPEYRVLVCGGRDYGKRWDECHSKESELVIVHGAATGADSLASAWAKSKHIREMPFPADWSGGRSAGIERNIEMLEESEPQLIIAFPGGNGTAHMVSLARKTKTPLLVIEDENS
ncbi:DUF2493 domain-containing protein [bacterium]|nr:DUF2493 domain-containing protein [bacterium]